MKKFLATVLSFMLLISFSACNDKPETKPENSTPSKENTTNSTPSDTQNETPTPEEDTSSQKPTEDKTPKPQKITYSLFMTDTFNDDGSVNFDVIACDCIQFLEDQQYLVHSEEGIIFDFEIPEKVIYDKIVKKYAFSDADWAAFKEKGSYNLRGPETATYENGIFKYRRVDGWGGYAPVEYKILNYSNNKNGVLSFTYQVTPEESDAYKVTVTYKYNKAYNNAELNVVNPSDEYYVGAITSTNKNFIDSLRIASITKS